MEVIAPDVAFATARMEGFNTNTIRLETNGATSANPNSIVTINLPSNCIVDMKSWTVHLRVQTSGGTSNGATVHGKLPADTSSLIQQFEVYAGGVQISQGFSEFNTVSKVKKLLYSSRDRDGSIDRTLYHGEISTTDGNEDVSIMFKPLIGLFSECSTRYWPLSIMGDVSVRITLAPNAVLTSKVDTKPFATDMNADELAAAAICAYTVPEIHSTIDTVALGDAYEAMLLSRLASEAFIACNYKEYYTFSQHGITTDNHDTRFALSATSIDRIYSVHRLSNYQQPGIIGRTYTDVQGSDAGCANYFFFHSFNTPVSGYKQNGTLQYQFQVNNVQHPQYKATVLDGAHGCLMCSDQHGLEGRGNMITSLSGYQNGKAIFPLQLSKPGESINVQSGYNSRGNNSHCNFSVSGQAGVTNLAAASPNSQIPAVISNMIIVETTAQLRVSGAKNLIPVY